MNLPSDELYTKAFVRPTWLCTLTNERFTRSTYVSQISAVRIIIFSSVGRTSLISSLAVDEADTQNVDTVHFDWPHSRDNAAA